MAPFVIARFEAGRRVGLGHLVRCRALLDRLADLGWDWAVAVNDEATTLFPGIAARAVSVADDDSRALRARWPGGCDLMIVDHYNRGARFEATLRGWARKILVIDDLADRPHDADYLLDQTPGRGLEDYAGLLPAGARGLFGGEHALLRPQFQAARPAALARRDGRGVERIVIAFGGSDPDGWTGRALAAVAASGFAGTVDVVLGAAASSDSELEANLLSFGGRAVVHRNVSDMAGLLMRADLAIGAAGVSSWERCVLGLPSLAVVVVENQQHCAAALTRAGAALVSGSGRLGADLERMLHDAELRRRMARAGADICDGRGLQRVVLALLPGVPVRGGLATLRLADSGDSDLMLAWQSLPEIRRYARNPAVPTPAGHAAWLAGVLADPRCWLMLIELDGRPIGVLRLDGLDQRGFEVSILVEPSMQGRGLAQAALRLAQALCPGVPILAEVNPANTASRTLFRNAGFDPVDDSHWRWQSFS